MIGSFLKRCEFFNEVKIIHIDTEARRLFYILVKEESESEAISRLFCDLDDKLYLDDKAFNYIYTSIEEHFERLKQIIREIQNHFDIGTSFFIFDIDSEVIHVFDFDYDINFKGNIHRISTDFTQVAVFNCKV